MRNECVTDFDEGLRAFHVCCSDAGEDILSRLQQLQSRFTWDLKKEDLELDDLSKQLQHDIELGLGQRGAVAHAYSFLAYVRYLQDRPEEAESLLNQSEEKTRECFGEESERRLTVMFGDLAWLKYHSGDYKESETSCQRVDDILNITETHPEESPATKQLRRALEMNPDDGVLLSLLALKLLIYQKRREAGGLVERATEVAPDDPQVIRNVAKYLRKQNQLDPSIDLLKKVLERSSQSAHIHHQLALCYMRKKKLLTQKPQRPEKEVQSLRRLCIHHLEETVRLKSSFNHAKAALALQYAEDYQRNRARETFEDVLEKLEKEPDSIRQFIYRCYAEFLQYHTTQKDLAITYNIKGQLTAGG
ncbi:interferon-induced protein with tetratricopeptide repeats 1-like [Trachinotus anak]|uniref:interferon-induced protein with tetratricopeptide repeats 1-like n=1 Tax=Trachinotus anak TaxID=443729 RepID=UPI0039F25455